jgi:hypothetical protein
LPCSISATRMISIRCSVSCSTSRVRQQQVNHINQPVKILLLADLSFIYFFIFALFFIKSVLIFGNVFVGCNCNTFQDLHFFQANFIPVVFLRKKYVCRHRTAEPIYAINFNTNTGS